LIARLKGVVDAVDEDSAIIDVNGVGYLVSASSRTLRDLSVGQTATVLVETIVREDAIALYGFLDTAERDWFRILTTVQGVGARVGLSILSTLSPDEIARAIAAGDKASLSRPAGVGPKLAARLATELKDKAAAFGVAPAPALAATAAASMAAGSVNEDAVSALVNLGYGQPQAAAAIAAAARSAGEGAEVRTLIRLGLKELAK
jgi:holliday junction DNA helicase RuvA